MDIWSWIIVYLIALMAILIVIETILNKNKERDRLKPIFALLYRTKEYIRFISTFHNHFDTIKEQLPQISDKELAEIYISILNRSSALAAVTYLRAEKTFDSAKNTSSAISSILDEDREMINDFLNVDLRNDSDSFDIDLYDERLSPIRKILKKETNKIALGTVKK